jgi:hypothetical protein
MIDQYKESVYEHYDVKLFMDITKIEEKMEEL